VRLPVGTTIGEGEKALIQLTLRKTGNNKKQAAGVLRTNLTTPYNKLKEYDAGGRGVGGGN
jgi:DNA-binding NtrC family response regulator